MWTLLPECTNEMSVVQNQCPSKIDRYLFLLHFFVVLFDQTPKFERFKAGNDWC